MSRLKSSWSAFSRDIAARYLDGYGSPSERSKGLVGSLLQKTYGGASFKLADFGCGNGHMLSYLESRGLRCDYFGYDFSTVLLDAARERYAQTPNAHFHEIDIDAAESAIAPCDIVLFSHVVEMLQSPEKALLLARAAAPLIMIRFFEPPDADCDLVEIRDLDVGGEKPVPYLRRKMSRDYYNMVLNKIGCRSVDVHQVDGDKDQVHMLRF